MDTELDQTSTTVVNEDPLAFARGFLFAWALALPLLFCIGAAIYLAFR